jgi:hypothetical protein
MTKETNVPQKRDVRAAVGEKKQIHLPEFLTEELAFTSSNLLPKAGGLVCWYHDPERDKAVLASDSLDSESLELVDTCSLVGVSAEDIEAGDVGSSLVTISAELPDGLNQRLRDADEVILKSAYLEESGEKTLFVSVYAAEAYDRGEPRDVSYEPVRIDNSTSGTGEEQAVKGSTERHVNVIY